MHYTYALYDGVRLVTSTVVLTAYRAPHTASVKCAHFVQTLLYACSYTRDATAALPCQL
jgi:hypothetical protein